METRQTTSRSWPQLSHRSSIEGPKAPTVVARRDQKHERNRSLSVAAIAPAAAAGEADGPRNGQSEDRRHHSLLTFASAVDATHPGHRLGPEEHAPRFLPERIDDGRSAFRWDVNDLIAPQRAGMTSGTRQGEDNGDGQSRGRSDLPRPSQLAATHAVMIPRGPLGIAGCVRYESGGGPIRKLLIRIARGRRSDCLLRGRGPSRFLRYR